MDKKFTTIIMAAGEGTRMKSSKSKVLHKVAGRTMLKSVIDEFTLLGSSDLRVIVGKNESEIKKAVTDDSISFYKQEKPLGTANAVLSGLKNIKSNVTVVVNGDHPLLEADDIRAELDEFSSSTNDLLVLSCKIKKPGHFGRILRDENFLGIREFLECTESQKKIREVNTGVYFFKTKSLVEHLPSVKNENSKKEYYLTDIIEIFKSHGLKCEAKKVHQRVAFGVNTQEELSKANKYKYKRNVKNHQASGVSFIDTKSAYIDTGVMIGSDVIIEPGVRLSGQTKLSKNVTIKQGTIIEDSEVGEGCVIGPYAKLRGHCKLASNCEIGNFVELKKVIMDTGSKAKHLTYLGDAEIGKNVNIGCGVITCNYAVDRKKYKTIIGNNVFVGSDVQFVAPVEISDDTFIASGSTITKKVETGELAIARGRQKNIKNYKPKG